MLQHESPTSSAHYMLQQEHSPSSSSREQAVTMNGGGVAGLNIPPPIATLPNLGAFPVLINAPAAWPTANAAAPPVTSQSAANPTVSSSGGGGNAIGGSNGGGGSGAKTPRPEADSPPQDPEIVTTVNSKVSDDVAQSAKYIGFKYTNPSSKRKFYNHSIGLINNFNREY